MKKEKLSTPSQSPPVLGEKRPMYPVAQPQSVLGEKRPMCPVAQPQSVLFLFLPRDRGRCRRGLIGWYKNGYTRHEMNEKHLSGR